MDLSLRRRRRKRQLPMTPLQRSQRKDGRALSSSPSPKPEKHRSRPLASCRTRQRLFVSRLHSAPNFANRSLKFTLFVGSTTPAGTSSRLRLESLEPPWATPKTKTCRSSIVPLLRFIRRMSVRYRFRGQPSGFCGREILVILVHS